MPTGKAVKPAWMADFPRASAVWDEVAPMIEAMGLLADADVGAFARYCTLQAEFRQDPNKFQTNKMRELSSLEAQFGMTPSARVRLGTRKTPKANKFAALA